MFKRRKDGDRANFPNNLRKLRIERGWSQAKLGSFLGVSRQSVSKWEVGKSFPDFSLYVKLAEIFEVDEADLLAAPPIDYRAFFKKLKIGKRLGYTFMFILPIYSITSLIMYLFFPPKYPETPIYYAEEFQEREIFKDKNENEYYFTLTFFDSHDADDIKVMEIQLNDRRRTFLKVTNTQVSYTNKLRYNYKGFRMYGNLYTMKISFLMLDNFSASELKLGYIMVKFDQSIQRFNYTSSNLILKHAYVINNLAIDAKPINNQGFCVNFSKYNEQFKPLGIYIAYSKEPLDSLIMDFENNSFNYNYENVTEFDDELIFNQINITLTYFENNNTLSHCALNLPIVIDPSDAYLRNFTDNHFIIGTSI